MRVLSVLGVLMVLAGCAETVRIGTSPPGAKVYIEEKLIGESPADFTVEAHHVESQYHLRLEKDGYGTVDDVLRSHVAVGRIVLDGLLTCGIVWAAKGWRTFEPVNFEMKPVGAAAVEPHGAAPQPVGAPHTAPVGLEPQPIGAPRTGSAEVDARDVELVNKLRRLRDLYDHKLINKQEYDSYKADVMKGL